MQKINKKAFTLTELLIVVIVIGILSAVVLPKFNKIVETRKTTEADEMMAAVRTEQEKRCVLGKKYASQWDQLQEVSPAQTTKHYTYDLLDNGLGMIASSRGRYNYDLKMLTFMDGRICCQGEGCSQLNKDYPLCESLRDVSADTHCVADAGPLATPDPEPPVGPEEHSCAGSATRTCCGNGIQHRTCDTSTGQWGSWDQCTGFTEQTEQCNDCGGTRTRVCNTTNGTLSWSACTPECECENGDTKQEGACGCNGSWNWSCVNHTWQRGNCSGPTTNCCTAGQTEETWETPSGYTTSRSGGCAKKTRSCNSATLTWSDYSWDYKYCCTNSSRPAEGQFCDHGPHGGYCSSGRGTVHVTGCFGPGSEGSSASWDWACNCQDVTPGGCNQAQIGNWCCYEYDPNQYRCMCNAGGGDVVISPHDPGRPGGLTKKGNNSQFSFYYAAATNPCPDGCYPVYDVCINPGTMQCENGVMICRSRVTHY